MSEVKTLTRDQRMKLVMAPAGALGVLRHGNAAATWAGVLMHWPGQHHSTRGSSIGGIAPRGGVTSEDETAYANMRAEDPDLDALD